ncbi:MAG: type II/IV secretion system protein [Puniceicoccaceae bacterium]|nr:MAG: type II/IV secretion system protein [Puniceicoccaceae bacterium]
MFETQSLPLYDMLKERELLPEDQLQNVQLEHQQQGRPLAELLLELELIEKENLLRHVAEYLGWEYLDQVPEELPEAVVNSIQGSMARMYGVVPLRADANSLDLLAIDPFNNQIVDDLTFALGRDIRLVVADPAVVEKRLREIYGEEDASIDEILAELKSAPLAEAGEEGVSESDLEAMANETPIIRFVGLVLNQAIRDKASDIHFEPFEHEFKIRYRIDGALYEMAPPPKHLALSITSRVKVMSNLNIAERRVPQDGRIKMTIAGHPVDLRVSCLPTQFGESVVLRVLDQTVVNLDIDNLGMPQDVEETVREIVKRPNGIFIVTGPTGSGKTTTLYSALKLVNSIDLKLLTAEDPVEYEIEGIMQVGIRPSVGLTFASALRSFLRQDPDIIMVGEIRDLETAQISIQASLTGHLVLSTLHTNDSAGAITRLMDMGVEPFLISSSLEAILAQRLLRRICRSCRSAYEPSESLVAQLGLDPVEIGDRDFYYGKGCDECNDTGYKGRMGIYEMLRMTDAMRDLVTERSPTLTLREKALEQGMRTLREDGLRAIFDGDSTIEEVIKYT